MWCHMAPLWGNGPAPAARATVSARAKMSAFGKWKYCCRDKRNIYTENVILNRGVLGYQLKKQQLNKYTIQPSPPLSYVCPPVSWILELINISKLVITNWFPFCSQATVAELMHLSEEGIIPPAVLSTSPHCLISVWYAKHFCRRKHSSVVTPSRFISTGYVTWNGL